MRILSIETSCDDTSIALVECNNLSTSQDDRLGATRAKRLAIYDLRFAVLANIVSSQTEIHRHWGGVVPNLAKREHIKNLPKIYRTLAKNHSNILQNVGVSENAKNKLSNIDLIAVTVGPGLEPALWTGIEFAKKLSAELKIPLVGANHLEGHLYSFLLPSQQKTVNSNNKILISNKNKKPKLEIRNWELEIPAMQLPEFPAIALLVSGGHTILLLMKDLKHWEKLGETRDDAVGEAFDKVGKMLGLPYPGGPEIEKLAHEGNPAAINFPRPMMREKNYDFSFSGLKTSVLYYLRDYKLVPERVRQQADKSKDNNKVSLRQAQGITGADVAASFQQAAIDTLVAKILRATGEFGAKSIILCGGVAANLALREALGSASEKIGARFIAPLMEYNSDNAAMIAAAAYMRAKRRTKKLPIEANGNLTL